jgi:hypothetical protein
MTAPLPRRQKWRRSVTADDLRTHATVDPAGSEHLCWWFDQYHINAFLAVDLTLDIAARTVTVRWERCDDNGDPIFDHDTGAWATFTEVFQCHDLPPVWPTGWARRTA